mmetsp:Transcript_15439/g.39904  ORF Transcript_15439/g.39904 Transcript_15439/m.39904 type:complete len:226 (-) Transcript_15439:234-911(-)
MVSSSRSSSTPSGPVALLARPHCSARLHPCRLATSASNRGVQLQNLSLGPRPQLGGAHTVDVGNPVSRLASSHCSPPWSHGWHLMTPDSITPTHSSSSGTVRRSTRASTTPVLAYSHCVTSSILVGATRATNAARSGGSRGLTKVSPSIHTTHCGGVGDARRGPDRRRPAPEAAAGPPPSHRCTSASSSLGLADAVLAYPARPAGIGRSTKWCRKAAAHASRLKM